MMPMVNSFWKWEDFAQQVVTGIAGAATPNTNEPVYSGYYTNLKQNNPDAVLEPIDPFTTPDGKRPKPIYTPIAAYLMIPAASKNAEAAIKYLNWMADPANILVLQNGEAGVSYEMNDEGLPNLLDTPESKNLLYNYFDYCIILNGKYVSTEDPVKNIAANAFEKEKEMLAKIVTAKPADFDATYEKEVKAYMDMGGTAVMEGKMAAYDEFYK